MKLSCILVLAVLLNFINSTAQIFGNAPGHGKHLSKTSDGGYVLCGNDGSLIYIVKTDGYGHYQWSRYFPFNGSADCIDQTADGGYILIGSWTELQNGDVAGLIRLNSNGDTLWTKKFTGGNGNYGVYVSEDTSGNFVVGEVTDDNLHINPFYMYTMSPAGNIMRTAVVNGSSLFGGYPSEVAQLASGEWITATINGVGPTRIIELAKIDTAWTSATVNTIEDTAWNVNYYSYAVCETPDSGFMVAGKTDSLSWHNRGDFYLVKFDRNFDTLWSRQWGNSGNDYLTGVLPVASGGYILAGHSDSLGNNPNDILLIRTDDNGNTLWTKSYGGSGNESVSFLDFTPQGGYVMIGDSNNINMWLIITDSSGNVLRDTSTTWVNRVEDINITVFPNPAHQRFFVSGLAKVAHIEIYNDMGELVSEELLANLFPGKNEIQTYFRPGVYTLKIISANNITTRRIILD